MTTGSVHRMSQLFVRTLREDPSDAEVASHRLLARAGMVRRVAPGIYSFLPLGKRVLDRVAAIVREEMTRIGGQEVLLPALLPREFYDRSGRWTEYGDDVFRLRDRKGADYLLGPTHEEMFTLLVKDVLSSYRDYPVILYQIQTKFRDEQRPRAGILRGREFIMKDAYSFDLDDEGLRHSYALHRGAYQRMVERLELQYVIVSAMSGAMGGSASEEFLATADSGEDTYVACHSCGYAANVEAVETPVPGQGDVSAHPPMQVLDTPDTPTIDSLVACVRSLGFPVDASDTLKNVVVKTRDPGSSQWSLLVIGVPGDREVDLRRLGAALAPAEVAVADAGDLAAHPDLVRGYIGPQVLHDLGVRYLVDPRIVDGTAWVTGANEPGRHAAYVVAGRDFTADGTIEAADVRAGDSCPRCGNEVSIDRGIEIGHIFQLGRKYADTFGLDALGSDGKPVRITMGSYGIGVSRAVAAVAEQHHDERGLIWPASVAPYDVHVIAVGKGDAQRSTAEELSEALANTGCDVVVDDRVASPGEKFADADLIGVPVQVIVGRDLAEGRVEIKHRRSGTRRSVPVDEIVAEVVGMRA